MTITFSLASVGWFSLVWCIVGFLASIAYHIKIKINDKKYKMEHYIVNNWTDIFIVHLLSMTLGFIVIWIYIKMYYEDDYLKIKKIRKETPWWKLKEFGGKY